jgi:LysR family transcriptional regulator, nitrogen assimilation regulatory protein
MDDARRNSTKIICSSANSDISFKIVDAGSFSRAASVVHVAQPALSQQIAELEERLGVMLLQRSARGVRPTAAGEILYKEASAILHQLDQLPSAIRPSSGEPEGTVSLGFVSSLAAKWSAASWMSAA